MAENHNENAEKMEMESLMKIEPEIEPKSKPQHNSQEYFQNISESTVKVLSEPPLMDEFGRRAVTEDGWTKFVHGGFYGN